MGGGLGCGLAAAEIVEGLLRLFTRTGGAWRERRGRSEGRGGWVHTLPDCRIVGVRGG